MTRFDSEHKDEAMEVAKAMMNLSVQEAIAVAITVLSGKAYLAREPPTAS